MKKLGEKEWMTLWALKGEPTEIPMKMLVQAPARALRRQLEKSRLPTTTGSKTLYNLQILGLKSNAPARYGVFRFYQKPLTGERGYPYVVAFPAKSRRYCGHFKHLEHARRKLRKEAERLGYV